MVKSIPSKLEQTVQFPTNEDKKKLTYSVGSVEDLQAGANIGLILSAKIVNLLPKE